MLSKRSLSRGDTVSSGASSNDAILPPPLQFGKKPKPAFVLAVTGLALPERQLAKEITEKLGGRYSEVVDSSCSYLVVKTVGSKKYLIAVELAIPIVSFEFVKACIAEETLVDFREYQAGAFAGLTICATALDGEKRAEIKRCVLQNRGVYDGTMTLGATTHLVVGSDASDSLKFKTAKEYNVKIVSPEWIDACVELGAWTPEDAYPPKLAAVTNVEPKSPAPGSTKGPKRSRSIEELQSPTNHPTPPPVDPQFEVEKSQWAELERRRVAQTCLRHCYVIIDCAHDPERWKVLRNIARFCGAMVLWEYSPVATHAVIVRSPPASNGGDSGRGGLPLPPDSYAVTVRSYLQKNPMIQCVQPAFLVECASRNEWVDEREFQVRSALHPLKNKLICVSSYTGGERQEVERLCRELGGEYTERLTIREPRVDILVCNGEESEKFRVARDCGIEVHDLDWLRRKRLG